MYLLFYLRISVCICGYFLHGLFGPKINADVLDDLSAYICVHLRIIFPRLFGPPINADVLDNLSAYICVHLRMVFLRLV